MKAKLGKKKGFTLVEVLVAMFCSILILGSIAGSLVFIEKINTKLISKTSNLYKLRVLEKYITDNYVDDMKNNSFTVSDGNVTYNNNVIIKDSLIIDDGIIFTEEIETYYTHTICTISYNDSGIKEFKFIANITSTTSDKTE